MSDLEIGLLSWLVIAVLAGLVIGRFLRMPEFDESSGFFREKSGRPEPLSHGGGEERRGRAHPSTMPDQPNSGYPSERGDIGNNP
ncbi:MAG: hypothetical protein Q8M09_15895 [Pseudomonadota bacterium]|nr:hypothetical protein [Pseudomonadota bacterium]MDP1905703.1 hypothetical protein [Pseudomonadota bacterium]MDP2353575.1 hypothetical protein [Pseudomonadota bacterium]